MKAKKNFHVKNFIVLCLFLFSIVISHAQNQNKNKVKNMVETKKFVFKAQTVLPLSGSVRQLTSEYDMTVNRDSIITYLPYFGRAYAPIDPNEGGIQFTSTHFDYKLNAGKKGRWNIIIKPFDAKDVEQLMLTVYDNGNAYLQVTSNNRQPISYNGYIVPENKR